MADPRVPPRFTARNLGYMSRPPLVEEDGEENAGILHRLGPLRPVPIKEDPDWYPPGGWFVRDGETTQAESQESGVETEGHSSLDDFV